MQNNLNKTLSKVQKIRLILWRSENTFAMVVYKKLILEA